MRKLEVPSINQVELYDAFEDLQYRDFIEECASQYTSCFENLPALLNKENVKIEVDNEYKNYMKRMYSKLSHSGYKKLYPYYTHIRSSSVYCPYCNFPTHSVRQVENNFPKMFCLIFGKSFVMVVIRAKLYPKGKPKKS